MRSCREVKEEDRTGNSRLPVNEGLYNKMNIFIF